MLEARGLPPLPPEVRLSNVLSGSEEGSLVGVAALAVGSRRGLVVCVAVSAERAADGLETSLVRSLVSRAEELGLRELYAAPGVAPETLAPLGFKPVPRDAVPGEIRTLRVYRERCQDAPEALRLELATRF